MEYLCPGYGQRKPDPSPLPRQRLQAGGARPGEFSSPHPTMSTFFNLLSTASMIFTSTTLRRTVVSRRTSLERFSRETFTWEQVEWTSSSFAMHTVDKDKTSRCDKIKHWHHWTWLDKLDVTFRREKEDSWHTKWDRTQPDQKMVGLNSKLSRKENLTPLLTKH